MTIKLDHELDIAYAIEESGEKIGKALKDGWLSAGDHMTGTIQQVVADDFKGGHGNLARSFRTRLLKASKGKLAVGSFSDEIYARIQDEGGTIRPKSVKNLAIPISYEAKKTVGLWPRHWAPGKLFVFKSKKDKRLYLAEAMSNGKLKCHYVLKKHVTISGQDYIRKALKIAKPGIDKIIGHAVDVAIGFKGT